MCPNAVADNDDDRVASENLGDYFSIDPLPDYLSIDPLAAFCWSPRNPFIDDSAACDDDDAEEEEEEEEEEDERNPFIVSDGHLSDDEGPDGGQPFLR